MKQGYYLYIDNLSGSSLTDKIKMQIRAFNEELNVVACPLKTLKRPFIFKLAIILPFGSYSRDYYSALSSFSSPDFFYIRMIYFDRKYVEFLARLKREYPACKILVEIPTYPYMREWCATLYGRLMYLKDVIYRKQYRRYVDRFVTYSDDEEINGIRTIKTMNGVDVDSFVPVSGTREYDPQRITLIAVAFLMRHHGYERIIEGLKNYYKGGGDRLIHIIIIGEGSERKKYERLIRQYALAEYIDIIGPLYGEDLNEVYDEADAGLSGFGFYKDGVEQVGTLKTREYLAKGIPVILGTEDKLFRSYGYMYGLLFPNDDSAIDFSKITAFLDEVYNNKKKIEVVDSIRQFAKRTIDNKMTLSPIIDYIENGDN